MKYNKLGDTEHVISKIGLGCGRIDHLQQRDAYAVIETALDNSINLIDLSTLYSKAEVYVGDVLSTVKKNPIIISKSAAVTGSQLKLDVRESLKNLKLEHLDLYFMHGVDSVYDFNKRINGGVLDYLIELKYEGLINTIGLSSHNIGYWGSFDFPKELKVIMIPYNIGLIDISKKPINKLSENGLGILAMKTLGGGFLVNQDPESLNKPNALTLSDTLQPVINHPQINSAIIGFSTPNEVLEAVSTLENIGDEYYSFHTNDTTIVPYMNYCRMCKYCCPCEIHGWSFDFPKILKILSILMRDGWSQKIQDEYDCLGFTANLCESCRKCESKCPFGLPIVSMLEVANYWFNKGDSDEK
jgi:predicted aldo/keto reductase-like oxidoreductase